MNSINSLRTHEDVKIIPSSNANDLPVSNREIISKSVITYEVLNIIVNCFSFLLFFIFLILSLNSIIPYWICIMSLLIFTIIKFAICLVSIFKKLTDSIIDQKKNAIENIIYVAYYVTHFNFRL